MLLTRNSKKTTVKDIQGNSITIDHDEGVIIESAFYTPFGWRVTYWEGVNE